MQRTHPHKAHMSVPCGMAGSLAREHDTALPTPLPTPPPPVQIPPESRGLGHPYVRPHELARPEARPPLLQVY